MIAGVVEFRREQKYLVSRHDAELIKHRLSVAMSVDAHARADGHYNVSSLYFDDPSGSGIRANRSGVSVRHRFRMRVYEHSPATLRLEKRLRRADAVAKRVSPLRTAAVEGLESDEPVFRLNPEESVQMDLLSEVRGHALAPAYVISYRRAAFVDPLSSLRITVDDAIRVSAGCAGLFGNGRAHPCLPDGYSVLEIKSQGRVSAIAASVVKHVRSEHIAISKYVLGAETLLPRKEMLWVPTSRFLTSWER